MEGDAGPERELRRLKENVEAAPGQSSATA
jgi:hypothetical protein